VKEPPMRDSKQLGYAILMLCVIFGIGMIILDSLIIGIVLIFVGLSPLFYSFYQSWKEEKV
jgi:threonine/homoserine/homoserine lactone efflux protein